MNAIANAINEAIATQTTTVPETQTPPADAPATADETKPKVPPKERALNEIDELKQTILRLKRTEKERTTELQTIKVQMKLKPSKEMESQEDAVVKLLAECQVELDDAKLALRHASNELMQINQREHRDRLQVDADDTPDIQFPDAWSPIRTVTAIAAMAENLQFTLINGESFYDRAYARVHLRQFGEDSGGTSSDMINTAPEDYDQEAELRRLELERDEMRVLMMALRRQYDTLTRQFADTERWWPAFTRRKDNEVRQQVETSQARRTREYLEQQQRIRDGAAEVTAAQRFTI